MSKENLEIVRRIFDSWAKGDFRAGVDHFDPNILFIVRSPLADPVVALGPDAIRDYWREFLRQWAHYVIEAKELKPIGDTIVASTVWRATGHGSGIPIEVSFFMLFTFRGQKIVRLESIVDESEALEAAGLREQRKYCAGVMSEETVSGARIADSRIESSPAS